MEKWFKLQNISDDEYYRGVIPVVDKHNNVSYMLSIWSLVAHSCRNLRGMMVACGSQLSTGHCNSSRVGYRIKRLSEYTRIEDQQKSLTLIAFWSNVLTPTLGIVTQLILAATSSNIIGEVQLFNETRTSVAPKAPPCSSCDSGSAAPFNFVTHGQN